MGQLGGWFGKPLSSPAAASAAGTFSSYGVVDPSKAKGSAPVPGAGQAHANDPNYHPPAPAGPTYGSASGPGILENWFNQRANGTDPGYEYAMKRGLADVASGAAARGSFNSGAAAQDASDFETKMAAAREGQLDSLAAGAGGEHQGRLNSMFGQGTALANGEAGTAGAYDVTAANAMSHAGDAQIAMGLNKAGVDPNAYNTLKNNTLGTLSSIFSFGGGGGGGK